MSSGSSPTSSRKIVPRSASSKRPMRRSSAPVNAPLTCPNSSLSISPAEMAPQFTLTSGCWSAWAAVVDRASDQLLAGPGLSENQDRSVGRRDAVDHVEHGGELRAAADDLLEVVLAEDLFAQIHVLALELRLQPADLLVLAHVLDGERQLVGDFLQELSLGLVVLHRPLAAQVQRADALAAHDQRHDDERSEALAVEDFFARVCARPWRDRD